jgi:hypothetical protein
MVMVFAKDTLSLDCISYPAWSPGLGAKAVDANQAVRTNATVANAVQAVSAIIFNLGMKVLGLWLYVHERLLTECWGSHSCIVFYESYACGLLRIHQ